MSAVLTIVGSSARAAAQSAARSGLRVHAGDLFADEDLRLVAEVRQVRDYPAGLAQVIGGSQPGPWIYTGALENHPELIGRCQQMRPLLGNPAEVVHLIRDPQLLYQVLRTAGLAVPCVHMEGTSLPRNGAWLAKPCRSAGGAHISRLDENWRAPSPADAFYFQQRIEGIAVAAVYLATTRDVVLIGVTEQLCGESWGGNGEFRYCGSIGPREFAPAITDQFRRIGETLHRSFSPVGLFGVDAIVRDETVWPVEVNPRYTASVEVLERATGFEAIAAHVAACRGHKLPASPARHCYSGKLIVWARRECVFPTTSKLPGEWLANSQSLTLADIPPAGSRIETGWPIATVLAEADHADTVAELLLRRAAVLQACCIDT